MSPNGEPSRRPPGQLGVLRDVLSDRPDGELIEGIVLGPGHTEAKLDTIGTITGDPILTATLRGVIELMSEDEG